MPMQREEILNIIRAKIDLLKQDIANQRGKLNLLEVPSSELKFRADLISLSTESLMCLEGLLNFILKEK